MPADPNRVRDVFLAAAELPAEQRSNYLADVCRGEAELRAEVDRLLSAHADPDSILEPPSPLPTDATGAFVPGTAGTVDLPGGDAATGTFAPRSKSPATGDYRPDGPTETYDGIPPRRERPTATALGTVIAGRYTLSDVIGEGGMGSVYLATQSEPVKRQVALKLIKAGMDSKAVLARFDAERQALALMDHPNIARIFDGGVTERGQPFFVMELVQGVPLTEYCDAKRLTVDARLQLFVAVCQAVQHAHQKGIIHRDLKPGNVLVTEVDGRPTPKVIDFGVAKATELKLTDMSFADTGAIVGTPAYMSPEQADPSSMDIDTRTDVYALGVMLYELLTGSPPIDSKQFKRGAILEMLRMVREVEPPRPSTKLSTADALPNIAANRSTEPAKLTRSLRGELDWLVLKALEKDRTRRYESANAFAADVQRYLADEVVEARPPSRSYRLKKFVKRNKVQVLAAGLVFLALVAGVIGTSLGMIEAKKQTETARRAEGKAAHEANAARKAEDDAKQREKAEATAKSLAQKETKRAEAETERAEVQLRRAEGLVYAGKLTLAQSAFAEGNWSVALQHLEDGQWNLRGWEHRHLWTRFNSKQSLLGHKSEVNSVSWSPDGKRILTGSGDNTAKVWDAAKGQEVLTLKGHDRQVFSVSWSPDGKRILTGSGDNTARVWDAATGQEVLVLKGHDSSVNSVAWSPDGKRLLTGSGDNTAKVWDAATGQEVLVLKGHTRQLTSVAWSPDGKRLLTGSQDNTAKVWDAATGQAVLTLKAHDSSVNSVAWSPDGKRLLTGSFDSTAKVWDAASGQEVLALKGHNGEVRSVAWSHNGEVRSVSWSPDGQRILTGSGDPDNAELKKHREEALRKQAGREVTPPPREKK
ncbi:MAG: hypothetical protein FJ304_26480 [Planctomycetes bacterium]|nr:hypothetical protein [Planctomycetota bacterium]